jgi:hypothetical protein
VSASSVALVRSRRSSSPRVAAAVGNEARECFGAVLLRILYLGKAGARVVVSMAWKS